MVVRSPVTLIQGMRAFIEAQWAAEAAAVNASITDNVTIPTEWKTVTFSDRAAQDSNAHPALAITVSDQSTTGMNVTDSAAPSMSSVTLRLEYHLVHDRTPLTGNGSAESSEDYAILQALHVSAALRSLVLRSTTSSLGGHYPENDASLTEEYPETETTDSTSVIRGAIIVPFGVQENA